MGPASRTEAPIRPGAHSGPTQVDLRAALNDLTRPFDRRAFEQELSELLLNGGNALVLLSAPHRALGKCLLLCSTGLESRVLLIGGPMSKFSRDQHLLDMVNTACVPADISWLPLGGAHFHLIEAAQDDLRLKLFGSSPCYGTADPVIIKAMIESRFEGVRVTA